MTPKSISITVIMINWICLYFSKVFNLIIFRLSIILYTGFFISLCINKTVCCTPQHQKQLVWMSLKSLVTLDSEVCILCSGLRQHRNRKISIFSQHANIHCQNVSNLNRPLRKTLISHILQQLELKVEKYNLRCKHSVHFKVNFGTERNILKLPRLFEKLTDRRNKRPQ